MFPVVRTRETHTSRSLHYWEWFPTPGELHILLTHAAGNTTPMPLITINADLTHLGDMNIGEISFSRKTGVPTEEKHV